MIVYTVKKGLRTLARTRSYFDAYNLWARTPGARIRSEEVRA